MNYKIKSHCTIIYLKKKDTSKHVYTQQNINNINQSITQELLGLLTHKLYNFSYTTVGRFIWFTGLHDCLNSV